MSHRSRSRGIIGHCDPAIQPGYVKKREQVATEAKRHILVDTQGLLLHALVHSADIQDRDGGVLVIATLFGLHPFLLKLYADGGYQGPIFQSAVRKILRQIDVEIVKRSDIAKGFAVLPKRWARPSMDLMPQLLHPVTLPVTSPSRYR